MASEWEIILIINNDNNLLLPSSLPLECNNRHKSIKTYSMYDNVTSCMNASNSYLSLFHANNNFGCYLVVNNQNLISILLYSAQTRWYISHRIIFFSYSLSPSPHSSIHSLDSCQGFYYYYCCTAALLLFCEYGYSYVMWYLRGGKTTSSTFLHPVQCSLCQPQLRFTQIGRYEIKIGFLKIIINIAL